MKTRIPAVAMSAIPRATQAFKRTETCRIARACDVEHRRPCMKACQQAAAEKAEGNKGPDSPRDALATRRALDQKLGHSRPLQDSGEMATNGSYRRACLWVATVETGRPVSRYTSVVGCCTAVAQRRATLQVSR